MLKTLSMGNSGSQHSEERMLDMAVRHVGTGGLELEGDTRDII